MTTNGIVYIVGAGPGDPDLITVRGLKAVQQADVVVYDRLVNPALLREALPHAVFIYVGKEPGNPAATQAEINQILVTEARSGKNIVRLKGGDPFVFGRGGEECLALAVQQIPFVVVPGISSALAVPAYAGVPLTVRGVADSFTVVTGHSAGPEPLAIDWERLPQTGTLVILMGMKNLSRIVDQLIAHGRAPYTPAAIIQQGTTTAQETVCGTLADIVTKAAGLHAPAVVVVGQVAALHPLLDWFAPPTTEIQDWPQVTARLVRSEYES